jgi:carbamoylphosphate synthase large subunit/ribosomal protein S18 acetylase RimI-like enzyme
MNILLTSVGRRSYLVKYFKEALGKDGEVHVSNSSDLTPAFSYADKSTVTPLIYDKSYIPYLLNYCKVNRIHAIISLFDIDLPILSKNKQLFNDIGVQVVVSDNAVIDICNDKLKTYKFLMRNGFHAPKTYFSLREALNEIKEGEIRYPVIIKPRWGMGSIGVYDAENETELNVLFKKTLSNIKSSYLKYESQEKLKESVIIQEKLAGQEYGLDIINDLNGKYQNTIVKVKYAMRSGETDCAETVDSPILKRLGESISHKLQHIGNLDVDVFLNEDTPYILEMNARFGGGYPFSHMAGVNLPKAIVHWLKEGEIPMSLVKENIGVLCHKDINIINIKKPADTVKCVDSKCLNIIRLSSKEEIIRLLNEYDFMFTPSISSRIKDLEIYAYKLQNNAFVYSAKDDTTIGFIAFYANDKHSKTAYITFLGVLPYVRKRGIGTTLLKLCFDVAQEKGMSFVKLEVRTYNEHAINFYKRNGFEFCGKASADSMYMMKKLNGGETD